MDNASQIARFTIFSIIILIIDGIFLFMGDMVSMEGTVLAWKSYHRGFLAKASHGCYLVYQRSDIDGGNLKLWFAKYEASGIREQPRTPFDFETFANVEHAQQASQKHAEEMFIRCLNDISPFDCARSKEGLRGTARVETLGHGKG